MLNWYAQRINHEITVVSGLQHPNILQYYGYMIMENRL